MNRTAVWLREGGALTTRLGIGRCLASVVLLAVASCSPGRAGLDVGVRRTAVDLAFRDESLPGPSPEIRRIFEKILVPPPNLPSFARTATNLPPPKPFQLCPKAPAGTLPQEAVKLRVTLPPAPGYYTYLVVGSVQITLPPPVGTFKLSMPPLLRPEVRHIKKAPYSDSSGNPATAIQYETFLRVGTFTVTELWQIRADGLYLLERKLATGATTIAFHPSSPIRMYQFGGEGTTWNNGGVDVDRKVAMVVQGKVARRDRVDVCGTVVDSYRIATAENVASSDGSYKSQTERFADCPEEAGDTCGTKANYRNFATHLGPIPVRQEFHYTDQVVVKTSSGAATATIKWDYIMTLARLKPSKY